MNTLLWAVLLAVFAASLLVGLLHASYSFYREEASEKDRFKNQLKQLEEQLRQVRRSNTQRYEDLFRSSEEIKYARRRAANHLLNGVGDPDNVDDILDFWEDMGQDLTNGNLNEERVHNSFFHWIHGWIQIARPYIESFRRQENDDTVWEHAVTLYGRVVAIQRKKAPEFQVEMSEDKQRSFLQQEIDL